MSDGPLSDPIAYLMAGMLRHDIDPALVRRLVTDARKLFGGSQIYIPVLDRAARDAEIRRLLELGISTEVIARHAKTSVSTVRRRRSRWL